MRKLSILFCLALLATLPLRSQLVVYPGDANNNGLASNVDLLYLGLNYGDTGPARFFPNINWAPDSTVAWGGPAFIDPAYSDCDGNGTVDSADVLAIQQNFGLMHGGAIVQDSNSFGSVSAPHLQVDLAVDSVFIQGNTQFTMNVNLGSNNIQVDSIYGFAFTIDYDPLIVDSLIFAFNPNCFALGSQALRFFRIDTLLGKVYVAATNIDHINRMGAGTIATIGIVMDDDIRIAGMWDLFLQPSAFLAFSAAGSMVQAFPQGDTLKITTLARLDPSIDGLEVYPNPTTGRVDVQSSEQPLTAWMLRDAQGRLLLADDHPDQRFEHLDLTQFPAGCYFLELQAGNRIARRKIVLLGH